MRFNVSILFAAFIALTSAMPAGASWALPALSLSSAANYEKLDSWLCHPGLSPDKNICSQSLTVRSVAADGTSTVLPHSVAPNAPVDCFYVYPTVSIEPLTNSDAWPGKNESLVTLSQAGRYGTVCRVFAPVYRQRTLTLLIISTLVGSWLPIDLTSAAEKMAYDDVKAAFSNYLKYQNKGRGFILVGHSQGAATLRHLLVEEIEPQPALHARLIAAHLMGSTIEVPLYADVGGTFARTPVCRRPNQTACVIAFSSYREGDPYLAAPRYGQAKTPGNRALCVNPAALRGGEVLIDPVMPNVLPPVFKAMLIPRGSGGPYADLKANRAELNPEPFFAVPGQIRGECVVDAAGSHYLRIRIAADMKDQRADDYPAEFYGGNGWGMHLADMWLVQGDLVRVAKAQSAAWLALH